MKTEQQKRLEAEKRQLNRDQLSDKDQIAALCHRPGKSKREKDRLQNTTQNQGGK